jgi:hypothetical protein
MDTLVLSILGDIFGFNNGRTKTERVRITKKNFGNSYIQLAKNTAINLFHGFLFDGGINKDITKSRYSFNTLMLFATLKGFESNDFKKEYIKIYNKYGEKKLKDVYFSNNTYLNSLELLSKNKTISYDESHNDSMVISRGLPFGLLYWKKEERKKLIIEIINNISLTHKNNTVYLSAITLGLFISYNKNKINKLEWANKLVEYLLSEEFNSILKELKLYNTEFILDKEDYISMWNEYIDELFSGEGYNINQHKGKYKNMIFASYRANYWFYKFNDYNSNEYVYGLRANEAILIAYDSLLLSKGVWEKMLIFGMIGITDNSVMGTLCGILFGLEYGINESININQFKEEEWVKKVLTLGKNIK